MTPKEWSALIAGLLLVALGLWRNEGVVVIVGLVLTFVPYGGCP